MLAVSSIVYAAASGRYDLSAEVAHERQITQALVAADSFHDRERTPAMATLANALISVQPLIVALLRDRRTQTAARPDGVEAGLSTSPSRPGPH